MSNKHRHERKERAIAYKGGKCYFCGYDRCHRALSFHHLNGELKDFGISGRHTVKWSIIKEELDKCVLLCANCHAEVHVGIRTLDISRLSRD